MQTLDEHLIEMAISYTEEVLQQEYDPTDEYMVDLINSFVSGAINVLNNPKVFGLQKTIIN